MPGGGGYNIPGGFNTFASRASDASPRESGPEKPDEDVPTEIAKPFANPSFVRRRSSHIIPKMTAVESLTPYLKVNAEINDGTFFDCPFNTIVSHCASGNTYIQHDGGIMFCVISSKP